jgi:hypothetical protein
LTVEPAVAEPMILGVMVLEGDVGLVDVTVGATSAELKVAVSVPLGPIVTLQVAVVPVHELTPEEGVKSACPLQPANVEPEAAVAVIVTSAPLSEVLMFGEHVLLTV